MSNNSNMFKSKERGSKCWNLFIYSVWFNENHFKAYSGKLFKAKVNNLACPKSLYLCEHSIITY